MSVTDNELEVLNRAFNALAARAAALELEIADRVHVIYDAREWIARTPAPPGEGEVAAKQKLIARLDKALGEELDDD